jgi:hypothetical protein
MPPFRCRRPTNASGLIGYRNRAFTGPAFASIFMRRFEAGLYRERESNVKATQAHFSLIPTVCRAMQLRPRAGFGPTVLRD